MIELWVRDEYGQATIIDRYDALTDLFKKSLEVLESENFDNALTSEETEKNWSCYVPIASNADGDGLIMNYLYSGSSVPGRYDFLNYSNDGEHSRQSVDSLDIKMLIGYSNGEYIFAKDHKKKEIDKLDSESLRLKSFLFYREKK